LLVDDDAVDRELFIEGMNETGISYTIAEAAHGEEALQYLKDSTKSPSLIILDLNMPVKDGRETLRAIKDGPHRNIPVFILSTSNAPLDVTESYNSGANLFLVKPHDFRDIVEMMKCLFTVIGKYATFN
jgi:two-component system response regulator